MHSGQWRDSLPTALSRPFLRNKSIRERERERQRERERKRERERDRQTDRQTDIQTDTGRDRDRETLWLFTVFSLQSPETGENNIQHYHKSAYSTIQNTEFSICILISLIHSIIHPSIYPFTHLFILYRIPYIFNIVNREMTYSLKLQAKRYLQG